MPRTPAASGTTDVASCRQERAEALDYPDISRHHAIVAAYDLLCELREAGISVAPAGDRLAVSAHGPIPEAMRERLRAQKEPVLRLLSEAGKIAAEQTEAIIAWRIEAGMELLWELELAGKEGEAGYARHLAMFAVVLWAMELRGEQRCDNSELSFARTGRHPSRHGGE